MSKARDLADFISDSTIETAELADNAVTSAKLDETDSYTVAGLTTTGDITFGDNDKAIFGAGSDLQIYHDTSGSHSQIKESGTGNLQIWADDLFIIKSDGSETKAQFNSDSHVRLFYDGIERFRTTSTGIDVTGTAVTDGLTVSGNVSVDGGTIKLDGNYPVGSLNVALGNNALNDGSLSGGYNTAIGNDALTANTSGSQNTSIGAVTLDANTSGSDNSALGSAALTSNTTGSYNTGIGRSALSANTTASNNTAVGYEALRANTTGASNVAVGGSSLASNTTADNNTAVGYRALEDSTTASNNTAVGYLALTNSTTGTDNTAVGYLAGQVISTGSKNTIIGRYNGNQGGLDIRTSSNNIVLSDGDGNPRVRIDNNGTVKASNSVSNCNRYTAQGHVFHSHDDSVVKLFIEDSSTNPFGLFIDFSQASPDDNTNYFAKFQDNTTDRLIIRSDGDVVNHDNSYGAISDIKLKEQITDASSQWDDIKSLNIRKYKMKSDVAEKGDSDEHWRLGVIAQEVEEAGMSGLIKTNPDMIENENGEMVESGEYTKTVKYSILYMKAVKALQEAMDRIETLEAKVATLEGN